jgi:hypothetical protein
LQQRRRWPFAAAITRRRKRSAALR